MPHIPLYVPDDAYDPNPGNAYKCTVEHIDQQVGRILKTLRELDLAESTYVIFTSDNGPLLHYSNHGGNAGKLRGGKGTTFEGGQRVPFIAWAPGRVPSGVATDQLVTSMDILPTIASLAGSALPNDRQIDGIDASTVLLGVADQPVREEFLYYDKDGHLRGIRQGRWKLRISEKTTEHPKSADPQESVMLFDLVEDVREKRNVASQNPERIIKLRARMSELDRSITENSRITWTLPD